MKPSSPVSGACSRRGVPIAESSSKWWAAGRSKKRRISGEPRADESYIFGTGKPDRPHLAIEVEWTHGGIDKLAIYEKLGVEEVWFWRKGVIEVYILTDGKFTQMQRSRLFPELDLKLLASMLDRDTLSQAVRDFRKAYAEW